MPSADFMIANAVSV